MISRLFLDLRCLWLPSVNLSRHHALICSQIIGVQKALEIICGIRKLAYEATGYQDSREYLWGLLLNAIFIGSLAEERSSQRCRAIILASVLCERLNRWDQEWPPAEWLPVLQDHALAQT